VRDGLGRIQSVLVLGGGSDIGLATAERFVREGARSVTLAGRKPEILDGARRRLERAGATDVRVLAFDAGEFERHADLIDEAFSQPQDVDVAVLAFGILGDQAAAERDPAAALEVARTNYLGGVSVLLPLAGRMRGQGHGTIVVLSSVAGERGRRSNFVYGSTKAGLDVFCQGLGDRLLDSGVSVVIVRPGFVRSKMTAALRPAPLSTTPDAAARAIVDAVRRDATIVWVPASLRWVMSALRHLPRPIFRRLEI
jgi:decaprenylphospho-beta-D-erythro-pentofuranosid-2-ulose 2-reductase